MHEMRLPEGTTILELPPFEESVQVGLELARLGASDEAIEAVGGREALERVRERRAERAAGEGNGHAQAA